MGWEVRRPVWFEYSGLMLFLSSLIYIFKEGYFKQENSVIVNLSLVSFIICCMGVAFLVSMSCLLSAYDSKFGFIWVIFLLLLVSSLYLIIVTTGVFGYPSLNWQLILHGSFILNLLIQVGNFIYLKL